MPRKTLAALVGVILGVAAGLGGYTFVYAQGASYLRNDPGACANCHIMNEQYEGWKRSSHHAVATCNDCHTPPGIAAKYASKASNGFWHSLAFTTGNHPEPITIKTHNREIAEGACRGCHGPLVDAMASGYAEKEVSCIGCHGAVGHPTLGAPSRLGARR
jgi:cytochrome c nitrite reductase small subunit